MACYLELLSPTASPMHKGADVAADFDSIIEPII